MKVREWFCRKLGWFCKYRMEIFCKSNGALANGYCPDVGARNVLVWDPVPPTCTEHYLVSVDVCQESELLPNKPWCPEKSKDFVAGSEPKEVCLIHKDPGIQDNPKPAWMPRMVMAVLDIASRWTNYSLEVVDTFAELCGRSGVDYIRTFYGWDEPVTGEMLPMKTPFSKAEGSDSHFDLDRWDESYDASLRRLRDILGKYHVKIWFDLFDNCGAEWCPWEKNVNGVTGIYDNSDAALAYFKEWASRIASILPASEGHRIGLGNELTTEDHVWLMGNYAALGKHLKSLGYERFPFSGWPQLTAHYMQSILSPDHNAEFGFRDAVHQVHAQGFVENFTTDTYDTSCGSVRDCISGQRAFGFSDDGFGTSDESRRGQCQAGSDYACAASNDERVKLAFAWWEWARHNQEFSERLLDHVEFMPREIQGIEPLDAIDMGSLRIYQRLATEVFGGVDITRK